MAENMSIDSISHYKKVCKSPRSPSPELFPDKKMEWVFSQQK